MANGGEGADLKVAFDQQVFLLQEYGGISRYICSLAKQLATIADFDVQVTAPLHFNRNLDALRGVGRTGLMLPQVNSKLFRPVALISKHLARLSISRFKPDIVHETYFSFDEYLPRGARRVLTVYDMIHERYAANFARSHMTSGPKKAAALRADHVICISENTRRDVVELCGIPEEKTSVVYLGVDEAFLAPDAGKETDAATRPPFLLYVGSRDGYKNFGGFVKAFGSSGYLRDNFSIVCFGGGPLRTDELSDAAAHGLRADQIRHLAGDDRMLARLYREAAAFIYPSLYEGFGIPPLEAMALGCPVICSNTSSLPEVVGDAGEYFDPNSPEAMAAAMEHVLQSPARQQELVAQGRLHCSNFSWEQCAQETAAVYRRLM